MLKKLLVLFVMLAPFAAHAVSTDLSASRFVESTADSSVAAKNRAVAETRKSLTMEILRRVSTDSPERIEKALEGFTDTDAQVLVRSMNIENEKFSATSYNATIAINLDRAAVTEWFSRNDLSTRAATTEAGWTTVYFTLPDGLTQWKWLNTKLREAGVQNRANLQISKISGNQIVGKVPDSYSRGFTKSLRDIGANVYAASGAIRVSLPPESSKPE